LPIYRDDELISFGILLSSNCVEVARRHRKFIDDYLD